MKKKLDIKIQKDSKKDFTRKIKKGTLKGCGVLYSRFNAKGNFLDKKLEFNEAESHSRMSVEFPQLHKLLKKRLEYGMDFPTSNGDLLILKHKLDTKGRPIITSIELIGSSQNINNASLGGKDGR